MNGLFIYYYLSTIILVQPTVCHSDTTYHKLNSEVVSSKIVSKPGVGGFASMFLPKIRRCWAVHSELLQVWVLKKQICNWQGFTIQRAETSTSGRMQSVQILWLETVVIFCVILLRNLWNQWLAAKTTPTAFQIASYFFQPV